MVFFPESRSIFSNAEKGSQFLMSQSLIKTRSITSLSLRSTHIGIIITLPTFHKPGYSYGKVTVNLILNKDNEEIGMKGVKANIVLAWQKLCPVVNLQGQN